MKSKNSTLDNFKHKFLFKAQYFSKKIGINFTKGYIYSINADNIVFKEPKTDNVIIKECKIDDLHLFGKLKDRFLSDMQNGHILIGAFLNDEWIGYNWIGFKPTEMEEIERFIHFNGAYIWRLYVKEDYRQRGIAKKMLDFSLNQIKNTYKKNRIYAAVETSNVPSIKTLESLKFSKVGTVKYSRLFLWKKYEEKIDDNTIAFLEN